LEAKEKIESGNLQIESSQRGSHITYERPRGRPLRGEVRSSSDLKKGILRFDGAELIDYRRSPRDQIPSFLDLERVVPLVPGRGVPLSALVTLVQMKLAGVEYGSLKEAHTNEIGNLRTALALHRFPEIRRWQAEHPKEPVPGHIIAKAILSTSIGRYLETVLALSGHRIVDVEVTGGHPMRLRDWPGYAGVSLHPSLYWLVHDETEGDLSPDAALPFGFTIHLKLAPL
jgi:hypothetical protein